MTDTTSPAIVMERPGRASDVGAPLSTPIGGLPRMLILCLVAGVIIIPLLATVIGGFKELGELRTNPFGLPRVWQWHNYGDILLSDRYWQILGNSVYISSLTVAISLIAAAPAAFAFAHLHFYGQKFLFNYLILGLTFPFATAILPLFIKIRDLGLLDTHWGVILPQAAFSQAISILLMRNAFRQLPVELLESALVDGCGYVRFFVSITLPLSRPILATVAVITFVTSWNNFLLPLVVLNTDGKYPWTLGLMDYQGEFVVEWQLILAFITLTILPAILMFVVAQRYLVAGLTAGAVKG